MKNYTYLLLLLLPCTAFCQQPVYQNFEVDSAAVPRGGMAYLNTFLQTNLRKPVLAEAKGIGGRVIITAVVEPDGHVSDPKIVKSLRPDCDREALRVFGLFNAWKPAAKGDKVVRQLVTIPVIFTPNTPYTYINGARVNYFNAGMKPVTAGSDSILYRQVIPADTVSGFPDGDIVVYQRKNSNWKEYSRLSVLHKPYTTLGHPEQRGYQVGYVNVNQQWQGAVFSLSTSGKLAKRTYYDNGNAVAESEYNLDGLIIRQKEDTETQATVTTWYANGQIKQIVITTHSRPFGGYRPDKIMSYWDSTGRQLVKEGDGRVVFTESVKSYADSTRTTQNIEQGLLEEGVKQGIWIGRYADGSYAYEERYERGICEGGKSVKAGGDTVHYTAVEQKPEFKGGMAALSEFLRTNLQYPPQAVKAHVSGKVLVGFVVDRDGTVQDVTVVQGPGHGCDEEAQRVVSQMPPWTPGIRRGKRVRTQYFMPVVFSFR